ncbi:amino acid adenylation domain-containing protein, partial [Pelomonas sp. CA6]|uniref:non-ribosomal peptide synthetase n=1 Tax=Pelomonas sp. CA6 TaxID=2907999 RepID=UPI001F4C0B99
MKETPAPAAIGIPHEAPATSEDAVDAQTPSPLFDTRPPGAQASTPLSPLSPVIWHLDRRWKSRIEARLAEQGLGIELLLLLLCCTCVARMQMEPRPLRIALQRRTESGPAARHCGWSLSRDAVEDCLKALARALAPPDAEAGGDAARDNPPWSDVRMIALEEGEAVDFTRLESAAGAGRGGLSALTLVLVRHGSGLDLRISGQPGAIDDERLVAIQHRTALMLGAWLDAEPGQPLARLPWMDDVELQRVLFDWNDAANRPRTFQALHHLVEEQARLRPDAIALEQDGRRMSYRQLDQAASRWARRLRRHGAAPEARVALLLPRCFDLVVAMLAALKSGAAYLPLDPVNPRARLDAMLDDGEPVVLLTHRALKSAFSARDGRAVLLMDASDGDLSDADEVPAAADPVRPGQLAYVIYTSGSTGMPKGVMVEHGQLAHMMAWHRERLPLAEGERSCCIAGVAFDACSWEVWSTLSMGATLALAPPEADPLQLLAWWEGQVLHSCFMVTALGELALKRGRCNPALRHLLIGGERLNHRPSEALPFELIHCYGPTETTVIVTAGPLRPEDAVAHIGRPLPNTAVYLLDPQGEPVPVGVPGELVIGGAQVARGYLKRPELTRERFVPDPFAELRGETGARMYRSGDLARWLPDGRLEFLGRNDQQVKIRGLRIELGEIEAQLLAQPGVREAVVLVREDRPGDKRLVAYVCADRPPDPAALREALALRLPAYMVPAAFVPLDALPLTPNGKLDRQALPPPDEQALAQGRYEAPRGEVEQAIAAIWARLLRLERVGRHDDFFALGGHSLLVVELMEALRGAGLAVDVRSLFAQPTPAALAAAIEAGPRAAPTPRAVPPNAIPPDARHITPAMLPLLRLDAAQVDHLVARVPGGAANLQDAYPLAPLQEGLLFHHLLQPEVDPYVLATAWSFDSRAALDAFLAALQQVIDRHDVLRSAVLWQGLPEPVQLVWREARLPVEQPALPAADDVAAQLAAHADPRRQRMDLGQAPLLRAYVQGDARSGAWHLQLLLHHLMLDHTTLAQLVDEIALIRAGRSAELPAPVPFRDYVARVRASERRPQHEAFFRALLGDLDEPTAPFGRVDVRGDGASIAEAELLLEPTLAQALRQQARLLGVSPAALFHWAWARVLAASAGRDEAVFGTVLFGRTQAGAATGPALGLYINTLPLRIALGDLGVAEGVRRTHELLAQLVWHEDAPLTLAQACSAVPRGVPLFSSLMNYRHSAAQAEAGRGQGRIPGTRLCAVRELSNYPCSMRVDDLGDGFRLAALAAAPIAADALCAMLRETLAQLARALAQQPGLASWRVGPLSAAERERLLHGLNPPPASRTPARAVVCVHHRVEAWARSHPQLPALQAGDQSLSYAELDARANRLAHRLVELGVKPESRVAVVAERGIALVLGWLAVLKAGGAYVPLDPGYPEARLAFLLDDCRPRVLLSTRELQQGLPACRALMSASLLALDEAMEEPLQPQPAPPPEVALKGEHLAYVIYTSGSTGEPKGVMVEHRQLASLVDWHCER